MEAEGGAAPADAKQRILDQNPELVGTEIDSSVAPTQRSPGVSPKHSDHIRTKRQGADPREGQPLDFPAPRAGLEPATNRLTADRSTD